MKKKILILSSLVMLFICSFAVDTFAFSGAITGEPTTSERNDLVETFLAPKYETFYFDDKYFYVDNVYKFPLVATEGVSLISTLLQDLSVPTFSYSLNSSIYDYNQAEWIGFSDTDFMVDFAFNDLISNNKRFVEVKRFADMLALENKNLYELEHIYFYENLLLHNDFIDYQPSFMFGYIVGAPYVPIELSFAYHYFDYDTNAFISNNETYLIDFTELPTLVTLPFNGLNVNFVEIPYFQLDGYYSLLQYAEKSTFYSDFNLSINFDGYDYPYVFISTMYYMNSQERLYESDGFINVNMREYYNEFLQELTPIEVVDFEDISYVDWIVNSVKSFVDFEIFPNFSVGNVLGILISMSLAIWILKVFMGG